MESESEHPRFKGKFGQEENNSGWSVRTMQERWGDHWPSSLALWTCKGSLEMQQVCLSFWFFSEGKVPWRCWVPTTMRTPSAWAIGIVHLCLLGHLEKSEQSTNGWQGKGWSNHLEKRHVAGRGLSCCKCSQNKAHVGSYWAGFLVTSKPRALQSEYRRGGVLKKETS